MGAHINLKPSVIMLHLSHEQMISRGQQEAGQNGGHSSQVRSSMWYVHIEKPPNELARKKYAWCQMQPNITCMHEPMFLPVTRSTRSNMIRFSQLPTSRCTIQTTGFNEDISCCYDYRRACGRTQFVVKRKQGAQAL